MHRSLALAMLGSLHAAVLLSATADAGSAAPEAEAKTPKSIVPSKYNDRYKNGGSDGVASFINEQSKGVGENAGFEFTAFFDLCRKNGIAEDKVALYEGQVAEKRQGANGRARMTLGNMLRAKARKDGGLNDLSGNKVEITGIAKPAVSGAAAAQAEKATETPTAEGTASAGDSPAEPAGTIGGAQISGDDDTADSTSDASGTGSADL